MKKPKKLLYGRTWLGWLNFLLLRWFFIRLAYVKHRIRTNLGNYYKQEITWSIIFRAPWRW